MKINIFLVSVLVIILASCSGTKNVSTSSNAFILTTFSSDETYGYTAKNPIKVGGVKTNEGPANQRKFLDALAGPKGENITYSRLGSCCPFDTKNGLMGGGLLDRYEVKWPGQQKAVILYINLYDYGELKVPVGFTLKK